MQKLVIGLVVVIGLWVMTEHAVTQISAETYAADARRALEKPLPDLRLADLKARQAVLLVPQSYEYQRLLNRAGYLKKAYSSAEAHAVAMIESAPSWGYGWLRLAEAKAMQGEFDRQFESAVEQAFNYAKHYDVLQLRLSILGASTWRKSASATRRIFDQSLSYSLTKTYRYQLMDYLFRKELEAEVCARHASVAGMSDWCESIRKLRAICAKRFEHPKLLPWCADRGIGEPAISGALQ